jgi:hypothetical protein
MFDKDAREFDAMKDEARKNGSLVYEDEGSFFTRDT